MTRFLIVDSKQEFKRLNKLFYKQKEKNVKKFKFKNRDEYQREWKHPTDGRYVLLIKDGLESVLTQEERDNIIDTLPRDWYPEINDEF